MAIDYSNPPDWLFVYPTETHFDELDAQWILHHSRQIAHVERAQQKLFYKCMGADAFDPHRFPDMSVVVRRLEAEYLLPLQGVRPFLITLAIERVRACTLLTQFEFRSADGQTLYTRGKREVCKVALDRMEPVLWTPAFMERYGKFVRPK